MRRVMVPGRSQKKRAAFGAILYLSWSGQATARVHRGPAHRQRSRMLLRPLSPLDPSKTNVRNAAPARASSWIGSDQDSMRPQKGGDAGCWHRLMKVGEFGVAAIEFEDVHGFAGCGPVADHRYRIGRYRTASARNASRDLLRSRPRSPSTSVRVARAG